MLAPPRAAAQAAPHGLYGPPGPFGALCIWIREPHRYVLYLLYRAVPQIRRYVCASYRVIATGRPWAGAAAPALVAAAEREARVGLRTDRIFRRKMTLSIITTLTN